MSIPIELTLEQQFMLRLYEEQSLNLNTEESRKIILELMRQSMVKDNVIRHLMKQG